MLGKDLITNPRMWQLVLEVRASALEAVAFSPYEDHALIYERIEFDPSAPGTLRALEDAVYDNPMLLLDFRRVTVLYDAHHMLVLPPAGESADRAAFRRVFPAALTGGGEVLVNHMPQLPADIAYEIPADIAGFLRRTFPGIVIEHPLAPVATYFRAKHPTRRRGKTIVNLSDSRLDMVVLGDEAPLVISSQRFVEPIDAVYHILAARERHSLLDTDEIMVAGDTVRRVAVTAILRRYVRYVLPAIFPSVMFRAGKASLSAPFEMILAPLAATLEQPATGTRPQSSPRE